MAMRRAKTIITLTAEEREQLGNIVRTRVAPYRAVQRARLILLAAEGMANTATAREVRLSQAMGVQWRQRFAEVRLAGLDDIPRPGAPPKYDGTMERRILAQLDAAPPEGHATWNGRLVAQTLGDVSAHQVWRVLRRHGIHLQRRRSWCVNTDPQFPQKAADIVALYLNPPENALVLSIRQEASDPSPGANSGLAASAQRRGVAWVQS